MPCAPQWESASIRRANCGLSTGESAVLGNRGIPVLDLSGCSIVVVCMRRVSSECLEECKTFCGRVWPDQKVYRSCKDHETGKRK